MPSSTLIVIVAAAVVAIVALILFVSSRRGRSPGEAPGEQPRRDPGGPMITTIGKGTVVEGRFAFDGAVQVDGMIKGEVDAPRGTLTVGPDGRVKGKVTAGEAILGGEIDADVTAQRVELLAGAHVTGALSCKTLRIHDGARLDGGVAMQSPKGGSKDPTAQS